MIIIFLKFIICSILIVIISKNILATTLRKLAQSLNLKSKTVGNIAGIATSVPELLSLGIAGFTGLIDTGIFNILSSNVINVLEYFLTVKINGNIKKMKNKVIIIELIIVLITIIIPVVIYVGKLLGIITSAPEFITFNEAQKYHKKGSKEQLKGVIEATNNLISSNMLNLFVIQSVGILIYLIS